MLKKLEKLENAVNKRLEALGAFFKALALALVPLFIKNLCSKSRIAVKLKTRIFKRRALLRFKKIRGKALFWAGKVNDVSNGIQNYPIKAKALDGVGKVRSFLVQTPLKRHAELISRVLTVLLEKANLIFHHLKTPQALIAMSAVAMISFGTYSIYTSSQKIYMQEWGSRSPASVDERLNRPEYLKYKKRTLQVLNIKVPIYVKEVQMVQSVTVDFTVRTSTRFAKQFLEEFEYKLKDHFFLTTEPMISTFPLKEEGKLILKEKIQDELNIFLKEQRVEGEVLEVDLVFLIAS